MEALVEFLLSLANYRYNIFQFIVPEGFVKMSDIRQRIIILLVQCRCLFVVELPCHFLEIFLHFLDPFDIESFEIIFFFVLVIFCLGQAFRDSHLFLGVFFGIVQLRFGFNFIQVVLWH